MDSFMVRAKDFVPIGYLFKSGKKTALLNTGLKRRFFFFANNCLHYQNEDTSKKINGTIDLENIEYYITRKKLNSLINEEFQFESSIDTDGMILFGENRNWILACTTSNQLQLIETLLVQQKAQKLNILFDGMLSRRVNLMVAVKNYGYLVSNPSGMKKMLMLCKLDRNLLTMTDCMQLSENITQISNSVGLVNNNNANQFWILRNNNTFLNSTPKRKLFIFTASDKSALEWVAAANWVSKIDTAQNSNSSMNGKNDVYYNNELSSENIKIEKMKQRQKRQQKRRDKKKNTKDVSASATSGNEKTSSGRKVGSRRKDRRASSTVGKARQMLQKQNRQKNMNSHRRSVSTTEVDKKMSRMSRLRIKRSSSSRRKFNVKNALAKRISSAGKDLFNSAVEKLRARKVAEEEQNQCKKDFSDLLSERVDFWQSDMDNPGQQKSLYELLNTLDAHFPELFSTALISAQHDKYFQAVDEEEEDVYKLLRKYLKKALLKVHPDRQQNATSETKILAEIVCQVLQDIWSDSN